MENDASIIFHISQDQVTKICNHFNVNETELEEYEICELLDKVIDNL